jgi:hypothetical protein
VDGSAGQDSDASRDAGADVSEPTDAEADAQADSDATGCANGTPWGTYQLALHNELYLCDKNTFQCTLDGVEDGSATLTLTDFGGGSAAYGADLSAPTLTSNHPNPSPMVESYPALIMLPNGDPWTSANTEPTFWDYACVPTPSFPNGDFFVTTNVATGKVTKLDRICYEEFATIYYKTITTGSGELVCP